MKKHIVKKLLSTSLALTMVIGAITGCGSKPAEKPDTQESSQESSTKDVQDTSSDVPEDVDPLAEQVVLKLTACVAPTEGDWNEMYSIKMIEEKFNVDIQVEMISQDIWNEKLPLKFATNDLPDFFVGGGAIDVPTYANQGYFVALDEYVSEELTPNLLTMWEHYPDARKKATELDGHIYNIAGVTVNERELSQVRFFINTGWAETILGKEPETLDEFYEYLKGVKEQDMNGNGDANDEIPLSGYYTNVNETIDIRRPILSALGITTTGVFVTQDGEVAYAPAHENYKEFLNYMNKLYEEKLLDQDYFTQTVAQFRAKNAEGKVAAFCDWAAHMSHPEEDGYTKFDTPEPFTSELNDTKIWPANTLSTNGSFIITNKCENVERLLMILDWCLSKEGAYTLSYGWAMDENPNYPGYGYKEIVRENGRIDSIFYGPGPDGTVVTNLSPDIIVPDGYETYSEFASNVITMNFGRFPQTVAYYDNPPKSSETWEGSDGWLSHNIMDNVYEYYVASWPTVKYTQDENEERSLLLTDMEAYRVEMETKMITGELDIEETWSTFIDGLKSRGLEDYLEIEKTAYERYNQ